MSLKAIHILFITLSILLTAGLGGWCANAYLEENDSSYLILASISLAAFLGLVGYARWFIRKLRRGELDSKRYKDPPYKILAMVAALGGFLPQTASACTVCYGALDSSQAKVMNTFILSMLGVTGSVLCGIIGFIFYLWRKSKMATKGVIP